MREKIYVAELATNKKYTNSKNLHIDDWDTCRVVYQESSYYDSEKGFNEYIVVVRRNLDGKFFKFKYTQFGHNGDNILEQVAYEVFEKEKTIKYYE